MATVQRLALLALGALVLGYLVVCGLVWAAQRSLIFPAPRAAVPLPGARLLLVPRAGHNDVLEREWGELRALAQVLRFARGG